MNKTLRTILIVLAVLIGVAAVFAVGVFLFGGLARNFIRHPIVMEGYRNFQIPGGRNLGPRFVSGFGPFGLIGGIVARLVGFGLLAALIALIVIAASRLFPTRNVSQPTASPADSLSVQEILDRRYARGEINREEYLQILNDTGHPTSADIPESPQDSADNS